MDKDIIDFLKRNDRLEYNITISFGKRINKELNIINNRMDKETYNKLKNKIINMKNVVKYNTIKSLNYEYMNKRQMKVGNLIETFEINNIDINDFDYKPIKYKDIDILRIKIKDDKKIDAIEFANKIEYNNIYNQIVDSYLLSTNEIYNQILLNFITINNTDSVHNEITISIYFDNKSIENIIKQLTNILNIMFN